MLLLALSTALASSPAPREQAREAISAWVREAAVVDSLLDRLDRASGGAERALHEVGETERLADAVAREVAARLDGLKQKPTGPAALGAGRIAAQFIDFEAWKAQTYVTSGVFPKRYFGYLDLEGDTAEAERRLVRAAHASVLAINRWQAARGEALRLTDAEVTVTFLAEGGALLLTEGQARLDRLHPVFDVGLDNLASGLEELGGLVPSLDAATGGDLAGLVAWAPRDGEGPPTTVPPGLRWLQHGHGEAGPFPYLTRDTRFEEGVEATALMALWEKQIAARKVAEAGELPLADRDLTDQFIILSLVYNSGLLHSAGTRRALRAFSLGPALYERSEANAETRPRLNLLPPPGQLDELRAGLGYREQGTSWNGAYHVLQRYGAYAALMRFTDYFKSDGSLAALP